MAGQLTIDTLKASSGVLATQNGMTGIAKAWVNFNGTGTPAARNSFNVSSITDGGTGIYTVNFTTAMPNADYCAVASSLQTAFGAGTPRYLDFSALTTTSFTIRSGVRDAGAATAVDWANIYVAILSS